MNTKDSKLQNFFFDKWAELTCVSAGSDRDSAVLLSVKNLIDTFNFYHDSFEGFYHFCKGEFIWKRPNADMKRFDYDPKTGVKINWEAVYEYGKTHIKDYSEKLEKKLSKEK